MSSNAEHTITCSGGKVRFIYSDDLRPLLRAGDFKITRASHVEPHPTRPGWLADMQPSGGPVLGAHDVVDRIEWTEELTHPGTIVPSFRTRTDAEMTRLIGLLAPFDTRAEALAAEVAWLKANRGL